MASFISCDMATCLHAVLGQSIKAPADLHSILLTAKDKEIVHFDDIHEMKKEYQTALYRAIEEKKLFVQGRSSRIQNIPLADFTVLLSSTDEHQVQQPLRDRCRLVLRFLFLSVEELTTLVKQRSQALRWNVDDEVLPLIAHRSRKTPRLGLRLLQSCHRVCRSEGKSTITLRHLERACLLESLDPLGLGPPEQAYLSILSERATRLNVIASRLGLPPRTVSQVSEPFLIRAGLIMKDDGGRRELTALGREHLSNCRLLGDYFLSTRCADERRHKGHRHGFRNG